MSHLKAIFCLLAIFCIANPVWSKELSFLVHPYIEKSNILQKFEPIKKQFYTSIVSPLEAKIIQLCATIVLHITPNVKQLCTTVVLQFESITEQLCTQLSYSLNLL